MTPSAAAPSRVEDPADRTLFPDAGRRREPPADPGRATAPDGGLWRGPTEGHWIARLLHGAPAPRDPTPPPAGRIPTD